MWAGQHGESSSVFHSFIKTAFFTFRWLTPCARWCWLLAETGQGCPFRRLWSSRCGPSRGLPGLSCQPGSWFPRDEERGSTMCSPPKAAHAHLLRLLSNPRTASFLLSPGIRQQRHESLSLGKACQRICNHWPSIHLPLQPLVIYTPTHSRERSFE